MCVGGNHCEFEDEIYTIKIEKHETNLSILNHTGTINCALMCIKKYVVLATIFALLIVKYRYGK